MTGPVTGRPSGGINESGRGGGAGSFTWVAASDGEPTERCREFAAVLTVGGIVFSLEGSVERGLRPGAANSGPVGASGTWSRDIDSKTGPFVFYDYDRAAP